MLHIVAIEGLDGAGKSYLVSKLVDELKESIGDSAVVIAQHFPYDETVTEATNKILKHGYNFNDLTSIIEMYANDRRKWRINAMHEYRGAEEDVIVLADRYIMSNPMYNVPTIMRLIDSSDYTSNERDVIASYLTRLVLGYDTINLNPEATIMLNIDSKIRAKRLAYRKHKDQYELENAIKSQERYLDTITTTCIQTHVTGVFRQEITPPNDARIKKLANFIETTLTRNGLVLLKE